ncbi:MAG: hypothetical protein WBW32_11740 [Luteibacter sp.]
MQKPIDTHVAQAERQAAVFLLPPEETICERTDALGCGAVLARQLIEHCVRGGRDDLAMRALELAQDLERQA